MKNNKIKKSKLTKKDKREYITKINDIKKKLEEKKKEKEITLKKNKEKRDYLKKLKEFKKQEETLRIKIEKEIEKKQKQITDKLKKIENKNKDKQMRNDIKKVAIKYKYKGDKRKIEQMTDFVYKKTNGIFKIESWISSESLNSNLLKIKDKRGTYYINGTEDSITSMETMILSKKQNTSRRQELESINMKSEQGRHLIKLINKFENNTHIQEYLISEGYIDTYVNALLSIECNKKIPKDKYLNVIEYIWNNKKNKTITKEEKLYKINKTKLGTTRVGQLIKEIPYKNYGRNDGKDKECMRRIIINNYNKGNNSISIKSINKYFPEEEEIEISSVKEFTKKYNIPIKIFNILGQLIYSKDGDVKHKKMLSILISNNHCYPHIRLTKNSREKITPELIRKLRVSKDLKIEIENEIHDKLKDESNDNLLNYSKIKNISIKIINKDKSIAFENIIKDEEILEILEGENIKEKIKEHILNKNSTNNIEITINNKKYNKDGYITIAKEIDEDIYNELFHNLIPNFQYESEKNMKMKCLIYVDEKINNMKEEYDINKAYYNIAKKYITKDTEIGIFTVSCLWEIYNGNEIKDVNYYLISDDSLKGLKKMGVITNMMDGISIKQYIEGNYKIEIEHVKIPEYKISWDDMLNNIERTDKIAKDKNYNEADYQKGFAYYNGFLGRTDQNKQISISNIPEEELYLLEGNYKKEGNTYTTRNIKYRHLNNVNIYNKIISSCNQLITDVIYKIKKTHSHLNILKIKTDSIGLDGQLNIELIEELSYFKKEKTFNKKYYNIQQKYTSGKDLINKIIDEIKLAICNNKSYCGPPGTGKTTHIQNNEKYDFACSITNACANNLSTNNIKGYTLYKLLHLYKIEEFNKISKKFYNKTIWIDEYSMIPGWIYNYLFILCKEYKVRFIISGDKNQLPPIFEKEINEDNLFYKLFFNEKKIFTKDYRNDEALIKLRTQILKNDCKIEYEQDIHNWCMFKKHICNSNETKNNINCVIMEQHNYKFNNKNNNIEISDGILITPKYSSLKNKVFKNIIYEVISHNNDNIILKNINDDEIKSYPIKILPMFELGFAITVYSCQGLTINEDLCIHEVEQMLYYNKKNLYTAITRLRCIHHLHLYKKGIHNKSLNNYTMTEIVKDDCVEYELYNNDSIKYNKFEK
jgi:hypothetical protein